MTVVIPKVTIYLISIFFYIFWVYIYLFFKQKLLFCLRNPKYNHLTYITIQNKLTFEAKFPSLWRFLDLSNTIGLF